MKGTVEMVNPRKGFIAVKVDDEGSYTVVELLGSEAHVGHRIAGDLRSLGGGTLMNETTGERMSVFVQNFDCTKKSAQRLMA